MSKIIRDLGVILWLSFSLSMWAQKAPERTKPAIQSWEAEETKKLIEPPPPPTQSTGAVETQKVKNPSESQSSVWRKTTTVEETLAEENEELREKVRLLEQLTDRDELIRLRAEVLQAEKALKDAKKKNRKEEDRFSGQARKEMEKDDEARRKMEERVSDARSMAKVHGCGDPIFSYNLPDNLPDTQMWVDIRAASFPNSKYRMITGAKYFRQYLQIQIINHPDGPPVDILWNDRGFRGIVVKNLCPGAHLTLMREREPMADNQNVEVQIQVIRRDGRVLHPQQYWMYSGDWQRARFPIYHIPNW